MRAIMLIAICLAVLSVAAPPAHADPGVEARVLRLEAQVRALQESLKNAVQLDRTYSIRTVGTAADSCLTSATSDAAPAKSEVFVSKCGDGGARSWKIGPAPQ
jgi:hypothetical protein